METVATEQFDTLRAAAMIIQHWSPEFRAQYGGKFPVDYTCFDTETTGFSRKKDLIVEWGHCMVRDQKVADKINIVINWFGADLVPDRWIEVRLVELRRRIKIHTGKIYRVTPELMRKKGVPVGEALPWIYEILTTLIDQGEMLVSHNGWNYDVEILTAHFLDFMEKDFVVPDNQMIDTGAIAKASQLMDDPRVRPQPGETMKEYFKRIAYFRAPGVKWNLDTWCVGEYDLVEKYGVDSREAHQAGYDAWLLHLLMMEFKEMADRGGEPALPVVKKARRTDDPNVNKTKSKQPAVRQGLAQTEQKRRRGQRSR